jgi:CheY-like chemotaxis protein
VQEVVVVGKINLKTCDCADILCVDDDPFNLRVLTQTLTKLKFVCHEAHDGEEAVQKVLEYFNSDKDVSHTCNCKTYGLIFMDIDMPRKNGFQASQEIT